MSGMFMSIAFANDNFELKLSNFDFSQVTSHGSMFSNFTTIKNIYVKDVDDQNWVISNGENSTLITANVLIKS